MRTTSRGFTLLEMLVVIAIIGALVAIGYAALGEARAKARDTQRKTDLQMMQIALRLYAEQYGRYPDQGCVGYAAGPGDNSSWGGCTAEEYAVGLAPNFIPTLPKDPNQEYDIGRGFIYLSNGVDYKLMVHASVENDFVTSYSHEFARCPYSCGASSNCPVAPMHTIYAIYTPGAVCW